MPLSIPSLDDRRYQELLDSALARIPVHTPEWTNFNRSDPGVTLIEVFAFLTETLLYRANQIPERNRRKFLSLLGMSLQPASSARGLVAFSNGRAAQEVVTLQGGLEALAGNTSFRTDLGLDVLPVEALVCTKRRLDLANDPQAARKRAYYADLYRSYLDPTDPAAADRLQFYETVQLDQHSATGVDLSATVDGSLWIALLVRPSDKPYPTAIAAARQALAGKTLSLGLVPALDETARVLPPGRQPSAAAAGLLQAYLPSVPDSGGLPSTRVPQYRLLPASTTADILAEPGIMQITLPTAAELVLWNNLDPLEAGVQDLPPGLEDTDQGARLVTWLRLVATPGTQARLLWAGINATLVTQRAHVSAELVGEGTGEPDQTATLARPPVIPGSMRLIVTPTGGPPEVWEEIDDLLAAGPEVPAPDLRLPPGSRQVGNPRINVFALDAEAGLIRFGDGLRGRRPPLGASLRADYAYGVGRAGNVGADTIKRGPALPEGIKVTNPVRTWGGVDAETVADGEKQIARTLQHRDRLVSAEDFATIARRTPGVDIARVEVLPAYHPDWSAEPGDAAGAVTLMLVPQVDPLNPLAPRPDRLFLNAVCDYLDPRRLITTELFLRGPDYLPIWISLGIGVVAGFSVAQVREEVRQALTQALSPFAWPLRKPVIDRELMAIASRVAGVQMVNRLALAQGTAMPAAEVPLAGLQLPHLVGLSVSVGDAVDLDQIRGARPEAPAGPERFVAVPVVPEECR